MEKETKVFVSYSNYGKSPVANVIEVDLIDDTLLTLTYSEEDSEIVVSMRGALTDDTASDSAISDSDSDESVDNQEQQSQGEDDVDSADNEQEEAEDSDDSIGGDTGETDSINTATITGRMEYDELCVLVKCLSQMKSQLKASTNAKTGAASGDDRCDCKTQRYPGTCGINGKDFHSGIVRNKGLEGNECN